MKNEEIVNHPNYCPLLFKGLLIASDSDNITYSHCPTSGGSTDPGWTHLNRQNWQSGLPPGCKTQCKQLEEQGKHSFRLGYVQWFNSLADVDPVRPEIIRLDFHTGNYCNAKCITCGPSASTAWANELNLKIQPHLNDVDYINALNLTSLRILHLTGGEPLMSKNVLYLLDKIESEANISQVELQISTNGSIFPNDKVISFWKKCKSVELFVSIDAIESAFEYIRYPLIWTQVEETLSKLASISPTIHVRIATTVGVHNIDELANTYNWFKSKQLEWAMADSAFGANPVWGELNLNNATSRLKNVWRNEIPMQFDNHIGIETIKLLNESNGDNNSWLRHLERIDQRRGLDWKQSLPLLYAAYKKSQPL